MCVCVRACVCVCERARSCACTCMRVGVRVRVRVRLNCVCRGVSVIVSMCVCVCVCTLECARSTRRKPLCIMNTRKLKGTCACMMHRMPFFSVPWGGVEMYLGRSACFVHPYKRSIHTTCNATVFICSAPCSRAFVQSILSLDPSLAAFSASLRVAAAFT